MCFKVFQLKYFIKHISRFSMENASSILMCLWSERLKLCSARQGELCLKVFQEFRQNECFLHRWRALVSHIRCWCHPRAWQFHPGFSHCLSNNLSRSSRARGHGHVVVLPVVWCMGWQSLGTVPGSKYLSKWILSSPWVFIIVWTHSPDHH